LNQNKKFKVALVTVSLSGGGAERVAASLSCFFEAQNIEIHHIVFAGEIVYNHKGKLLHLETLKDKNNSLYSRYKRFLSVYSYFKKEQFDYVVDFRVKEYFLQEIIVNYFVYKKFIQTVHSNSIHLYLHRNKFLNKILYKNAQKVVAVSSIIKQKIEHYYQYNNIELLHNPIDFILINSLKNESLTVDYQYILSIGRMEDNVKQFDHLIESYANSILPSQQIKLVILGEGKLRPKWESLTSQYNLQEMIIFKGAVSNPFMYYKNALYTVMTSKYEGFPMVLLESLACETPVISYNFFSNSNEIIQHEHNGLLVENQNKVKITEALNRFHNDKVLYLRCKNNAQASVQQYSLEQIGAKWIQLFNELQ
jgi:glycosyltransferase involved in cell wall biosynthesis